MITKETVIAQITAYLRHEIPLESLVDWAEKCFMDELFDEQHHTEIRNAIARLGVADVRAFGLTWDDCIELLESLGYTARIEIVSL